MNSTKAIRKVLAAAAVLVASLAMSSCDEKDLNIGIDPKEEGIQYIYPGNRQPMEETRRVLLFYECGFNSLSDYLTKNMEEELPEGYIPTAGRNDDVILVFSKIALNLNYKDVPSYLRRIYKDPEGEVVSDTLMTYPSSVVASSGETMRDVLSYVKSAFPAKGYGMVYSSHGSGWLPTGYYSNPNLFELTHRSGSRGRMSSARRLLGVPEGSMESDDPYAGMVRSIGQDKMSYGDKEMTVSEFASGIPFRLDYLLFDMCFSGGVEVAYGLKDKADYLGVSPAEVLAAGTYDYTKITEFLLKGATPDLTGLFRNSFDMYNKQSGEYRSSTLTLIRTDGLDNLGAVCRQIISNHTAELANAPASEIQGFYRMNRHYFYDLEDIFAKSGIPESEMQALRNAIDACVVYKAATPSFLGDFTIDTYSGMSMYLPCAGTSLLDSYYTDEPWNAASELVK